MGCDIHLFIEHKKEGSQYSWWGFGEKFRLDRDYRMFARLADVRNFDETFVPISKPRGLPSDISWTAQDVNRLMIVDQEEAGTGEATRSEAEKWVKSGSSVYEGSYYVTHPDWHSHSWLTSDEFETCIKSFEEVSADYKAVLAVLRCFESVGDLARVVFWFDN